MEKQMNRREVMKTGLAMAALGATANFDWVLPVLAQGETLVPFSDSHQNFNANPAVDRRLYDTRSMTGAFTPALVSTRPMAGFRAAGSFRLMRNTGIRPTP